MNVKIDDRLDKAAAKRNLLFGLTQRGCGRTFVPTSIFPPENEICPAWSARCAVRSVNRTLSSSRSMIGTSTPDRPHCGDRGNHRGIGVELVVPRDDVRICEPCRHIKCEPFSCAGKKFRRGEEAIVVRDSFGHGFHFPVSVPHWRSHDG